VYLSSVTSSPTERHIFQRLSDRSNDNKQHKFLRHLSRLWFSAVLRLRPSLALPVFAVATQSRYWRSRGNIHFNTYWSHFLKGCGCVYSNLRNRNYHFCLCFDLQNCRWDNGTVRFTFSHIEENSCIFESVEPMEARHRTSRTSFQRSTACHGNYGSPRGIRRSPHISRPNKCLRRS